jgi:hypothetical protein
MSLEMNEFLEHVDQLKLKLHEELKCMSPAQRKAFWNKAHKQARSQGLRVSRPQKPAQRSSKRMRRAG